MLDLLCRRLVTGVALAAALFSLHLYRVFASVVHHNRRCSYLEVLAVA